MEFTVSEKSELPGVAGKILKTTEKRVFLIQGDLGAGKTALIGAFCDILGSSDPVTSPTFAIVHNYLDREGKSIFHFDFYRINSMEEALDIGFEEYFDRGRYFFIEWPEKIMKLIPEDYVLIEIIAKGSLRQIKVHL